MCRPAILVSVLDSVFVVSRNDAAPHTGLLKCFYCDDGWGKTEVRKGTFRFAAPQPELVEPTMH